MVQLEISERVVTLTLNDPARRNAMSIPMFDALEAKLRGIEDESTANAASAHVLLLRANGKAFCAGFDLSAAVDDPAVLATFIHRLSGVLRTLRRLPMMVIAEVQGAALAGGCALLSACDLVIAAPGAKFGYPVHALGISPAVTIPTLSQMTGPGAARALLMGGAIIDANAAERIGLVWRLSATDASLTNEAQALCNTIACHGPAALRATKQWLNELDGSLDDSRFDAPTASSATLATQPQAVSKLREVWRQRRT